MTRVGALVLLALPLCVCPAMSQSVTVSLLGSRATHSEFTGATRGFGAAGRIAVEGGRIAVEASAARVSVSPAASSQAEGFALRDLGVRTRYQVTPAVAAEVSWLRRSVSPVFSTQDVGAVTAGVRLTGDLSGGSDAFVRGGITPLTSFSGGGSGGLSYDVGFGTRLGPAAARWRLSAEYAMQYFDRSVGGQGVPIQMEAAHVGLEFCVRRCAR